MPYSLRIPDVLQARINSAVGDGKTSEWILEACRMRLDGGVTQMGEASGPEMAENTSHNTDVVAGSIPAPASKPSLQDLRDICAGKVAGVGVLERVEHVPTTTVPAEIPLCHKTWWEDGEQYECLMDAGHKSQKHGQAGMVLNIDA